MLLNTTTRKLQALLAGAAATTNPTVVASWWDRLAGVVTQGVTPSNLNGTTAVDIVAAPAASTERDVYEILIWNADTAAVTLTVRLNDNGTLYTLFKATLAVGDCLSYTDNLGWQIVDSSGGIKTAARTGLYLKTTVLTSGTSFTTGPSTNTIVVRMVGGGAGGGGCTSVASAAGAAGGGGAGGYAEKTFAVTPNTAYTYAIGGGGTGVSGAAGNNGGNTTFTVGATTVTAPGGSGAAVATASTALTSRPGGVGGAVATNGDVNSGGQSGGYGVTLIVATPVIASGNGGSGPFGVGGVGLVAVGNGNSGLGFGAGGGGSATGASVARTGGNGTAGCIVVDEYA